MFYKIVRSCCLNLINREDSLGIIIEEFLLRGFGKPQFFHAAQLAFCLPHGEIRAEHDAVFAVSIHHIAGDFGGDGLEGRGAIHHEIIVTAQVIHRFIPHGPAAKMGADDGELGELL